MATNSNVALRLAEAFARHGVTVTFGQSLPSAFHLAAPQVGIRQAAYRQENAGGAMADGYARISRRVGVVTAQNGPAATLLVAPLAEALKASIPIVALVQEVTQATTDKNAFQELDHLNMFAPVAKWVRRIDRADRLEDYVDMAFTAATSGRPGPAVILVPADLLVEDAPPPSPRKASLGVYPLDRTQADPMAIERVADLIAAARHPIVVAGGGVHLSGACDELAALGELASLPIATTTMGKGVVDEGHSLSVGVVGYVMGRGARGFALRGMIDRADLVLLVGNRANQNGTDSWKLFPAAATFVHLDIDPMEVGRNYEAVRLVGDAKSTLAALTAALGRRDLGTRIAARSGIEAEIAAAVAAWRGTVAAVRSRDGGPVRPERVMAELDKRIGAEDIVVADASYASIWIAGGSDSRKAGQRFLTPRGIAGLGWGLPMAIGAQFAAPSRRVVCLCGDGGFAHSWAELETLRRLRLPVTVLVLNNGILGYQKHAEDVVFGEHTDAVDFTAVDHAAIARACGVRGVRVERGEDIGAELDIALRADEPMLIDVITDPDAKPPISFYAGHYPEPFLMDQDLTEFGQLIEAADRIVLFTGAGISTESGIPDFRSPGGIWTKQTPIDFSDFMRSDEARRETWRRRFAMEPILRQATPNRGHRAVAELIRSGKAASVITQNIDGLHQDSGIPDDKVIELHGNTTYAHCLECGARYEIEALRVDFEQDRIVPHCACGGWVKTATVSFGQSMPINEMRRAERETQMADLFIAIGSSLVVYPAAAFPELAKRNGSTLVILNLQQTGLDSVADLVLNRPIGDTLGAVVGVH